MDLNISNQERLDLKRLLTSMECDNNTDHIRKVKHSARIQKDMMELVKFKKERLSLYESKPERFEMEAQSVADFLYVNYTDIFRKVIRDEIDYEIMSKLLYVLKAIEDEKVDQHEGGVLVGKVLKELYLDSAVRHGQNLDKKYETLSDAQTLSAEPVSEKVISWKEFKQKST